MPLSSWSRTGSSSGSPIGALVLAAALLLLGAGEAAAAAAPQQKSITLTEGVTYRARLSLNFFQCLASRDRINRKLGGVGFASVRVFTSARELPPDWPAQFRSRAGSCERYVEGVWARPTMPRQRPSSIEAWWVAGLPTPLRH